MHSIPFIHSFIHSFIHTFYSISSISPRPGLVELSPSSPAPLRALVPRPGGCPADYPFSPLPAERGLGRLRAPAPDTEKVVRMVVVVVVMMLMMMMKEERKEENDKEKNRSL